jgi:hypothetical protein
LRQRQHGGRIDVAHHHHGGVGRHVPALVEGARVVGAQRVQIAHPAHHRAAVGRGGEGGRHLLLEQARARAVVGAHAALFLDHLQLLGELGVAVAVVRKAVGLQRHRVGQLAGRHLLVVAGVVARGEGVLAPAQRATRRENSPGASVSVPLNIRCSSMCATPVVPFSSSIEPTRTHSICTAVARAGRA